MTSLMVKYANEIAETMAKSLSNEEFTRIFKTAANEEGPALKNFKTAIDQAIQRGEDINLVYNNWLAKLQEEDGQFGSIEKAKQYMAQKASTPGHRQPGHVFPEADDECLTADCMEGMMANDEEKIAAEFTLNHLAKIADVLDSRGFSKLANALDETMQKITSQK